MKTLIIGDIHGKISRFQIFKDFLNWIESVVDENKEIGRIVNLGDTFNDHAVIRSEIIGEFIDHIKRLHDKNIEYWYIVGNHDTFKPKDDTYHALRSFSGLDFINIVDKPIKIDSRCFAVPFMSNPEDFKKSLKKTDILFCHQSFLGGRFDNGMEITLDIDKSAVSIDDLPYKLVVSGHIHKKGTIGKVFYPGSPYASSASDVDELKGVFIMNEDDTFEFIESPFPKWQKLIVDITSPSIFKALKSSLNDKDHFILEMTGTKTEVSSFLSSKKYKSTVEGKSVTVKSSFTDKTKINVSIKTSSPKDIVGVYIDKVYSGNLDKQVLLNKAVDIISGV